MNASGNTNLKTDTGITVMVISVLVLAFMVLLLLLPKTEFSERENRPLARFPEFRREAFLDGTYMKGLSQYLSDHFPFRDAFMTVKTETEKWTGRGEINGIYLGKHGMLIEQYRKPAHSEKIVAQFRKLSDKLETNARMYVMLVPTAVTIYNDVLPVGALDRGRFRQLETKSAIENKLQIERSSKPIQIIDCTEALRKEKERQDRSGILERQDTAELAEAISRDASAAPLYYRTDHHWTTHGAYIGYRMIAKEMQFTAIPESDFRHMVVSQTFHGTIDSKLNDLLVPADPMTIYEHPEHRLQVTYTDTNEVTDTLYEKSYLSKKDQYSMFLNNLHGLVEIRNDAADSDRELVLIKDSYANSIVPFLVSHFKKIYVFDTRYYKFGPGSFINAHPEVTDVLLLYNMNTIDTDLGIGGIY